MSRPIKRSLDYFNVECSLDDKVQYVEAKHGLIGFAVLVKLWGKIYKSEGYYCDWKEKNVFLFCKDINVEVEILKSVIDTCFEEGLFNKAIYEKEGILTSKGIQKRWLKIVTDAKRKDVDIETKYSLLEFTTEETPLNSGIKPEETPKEPIKEPEETPQSKVKETKVDNTKTKDTTPKPLTLHQSAIAAFNLEYRSKFDTDYIFQAGKDGKAISTILANLKKKITESGRSVTDELVMRGFNFFIGSVKDRWILDNFSPSTLASKFNEIYVKSKTPKPQPREKLKEKTVEETLGLFGDLKQN